LLAISGSFGGAWACGRTSLEVFEEVSDDGGTKDGTLDSPGQTVPEASSGRETLAALDSAGDIVVVDVALDAPSGHEAGDAGTDATQDSARDVVVADMAVDSPTSPDGGDAEALPPSCAPGGAGMTNCGPGGSGTESCCTSLEVTTALESEASPYYRTYSNSGSGPTGEADPATVSGFRLDKYLVTVGRFRQFVAAWSGGYYPAEGSGIHTHLNDGRGLANSASPGTYETGWDATDWNNATDIDPTGPNLNCNASYATWTPTDTGGQENLPINCVTWYEAYAFCIWDGGFLPSEAEWEYAAAAGNREREYPWGSTAPGTACPGAGCDYAVYSCYYPSGSGSCTGVSSIAPVGYASMGAGYFGQLDLEGEVLEWNLDWYNGTYVDPCTDCAYLPTTPASYRVVRGGYFLNVARGLLPSRRLDFYPSARDRNYGFRCARTP
jgi:formylglycine-generating enzyme required for sulfatase activity